MDFLCPGLVDKVVMGQRLELMILEVLSNLSDSVTAGMEKNSAELCWWLFQIMHLPGAGMIFLCNYITLKT